MKEIISKLWIGDYYDASNLQLLKSKNIKYVLTVMDVPLETVSDNIQYKFIEALDMETMNLISYFDESNAFISRGIDEGGVLVHCYAGISRSGTIVTSFIMKILKIDPSQAIEMVRRKSDIDPNPGFIKQLWIYHNQDYISSPEIADRFDTIIKFPINKMKKTDTTSAQFKCKRCRTLLFIDTDLTKHSRVDGSTDVTELNQCVDEIFVESLSWIDSSKVTEGKINCPKCKVKLGSFSWIGEKCVCSAWVVPAFHFSKQKVDIVRLANNISN